jgi:hypothetical protein
MEPPIVGEGVEVGAAIAVSELRSKAAIRVGATARIMIAPEKKAVSLINK